MNVSQLRALVWLKWALFRNALRTRRGATNRAASLLTTAAALFVALLVAAGLGAAAYALAGETAGAHAAARQADSPEPLLLLFGILTIIFLMWGMLPLSLGSGSQFDPGPLLLYPVSLRRLFLIDLLSETTSLASILAAPSLLAVGLGAGLARGRVAASLAAASLAALFGLALSKLLATAVFSLLKRKRARGETLLALLGVAGAFSGVIISRGLTAAESAERFPPALEWTPPGALLVALTHGPGGEIEAARYLPALAALAFYAVAAVALSYKIAVRALNSGGGRGRAREAAAVRGEARAGAAGWRLPFGSEQLSAVFEKEARYALRNAQLRVMVLMPAVVTFALSFGLDPRRRGFDPSSASSYFEGVRPALGMYYLFLILSSLTSNLFGYDGSGFRAFVLSPAPRRTILLGKNLAMLCVALAGAAVVTATNRLVYGPQSWRAHLFGALTFLFFAAAFATCGNWLSARYPQRIEFGKRMHASGTSSLLMVPLMLIAAAPPVLSVLAGWAAGRPWIGYAILAATAAASVAIYALTLAAQGRALQGRELEVLEAVARRDES